MAFSIFKVLKSLLIQEENTLTPKEIEIIPGGTSGTKTTIESSQTSNQALTLPDATDTLIGKATTDILTNKSIDADNNTITNIEDADIKALAAIDATKIADGSVTSAEFQYLGGVTSDIQTQLNTNNTAISDHLTDTVDAHDASAISNVPTGNLVATDVQSALDELQSDVDTRLPKAGGTMTGTLDINNNTISNVPTPTSADHAANKSYVDSLSAGLDPKEPCVVATVADLSATYATTPSNGQFTSAPSTIDGQALSIGFRVLVKDQTDAKQNGIYVYTAANELTRSADMDGSPASEVSSGNYTFVTAGTVNVSKGYTILGSGLLTLNTDNLNWSQFSGATNTALRDLSNLTSPTAINQHLLPDIDITRNIGSQSLRYNIANVGIIRGDGTSNTSMHVANRTLNNTSGATVLDFSGTNVSANSKKIIALADAELDTDAVNRQSLNRSVKNYIANHDAILDTSGYAAYADAAATSPVDGTGGSPTVTITRSTSSPLRGVGSFVITKDAANRQGEGVSYDFTIDAADKYKVLQGSFDYAIGSGTYADDDMSVWIYDVTNAKLIQPAPYLLKNHSLPSERMPFEFQCSDSTSYRLIVHVGSTSASAYTVKFDNVVVGPQAKLYGSAVTDWVSYTPTGSWTSNTTYTGFWRRLGSDLEGVVYLICSGAPTSASLTVNLPSGLVIDTSKLTESSSQINPVGFAEVLDGGTNNYKASSFVVSSTTAISVYAEAASGTYSTMTPVNSTVPITFGNTDAVTVKFKVPIQGWSSSQIMSSDANTRVVAASAYVTSTGQVVGTSAVKIQFNGVSFDTNGSYDNVTNFRYNVKTPGVFKFSGVLNYSASGALLTSTTYLYKNGSVFKTSQIAVPNGAYNGSQYSFSDSAIAGDYYEIYAANSTSQTLHGTNTLYGGSFLDVEKLSGPAQIMASESVSASYRISADKTPSVSSPIDFDTKIFDSHNAVTTGSSWKFTAPMSGTYQITNTNATSTTGGTLDLYTNGSQDRGLFSMQDTSVRSATAVVKLLAGQYVDVRCDSGSKTFTGTKNNTIYIIKVGNY